MGLLTNDFRWLDDIIAGQGNDSSVSLSLIKTWVQGRRYDRIER